MKPVCFFLLISLALFSCNKQKQSETIHLFNGENLKGWHVDVPALDENPDTINPFIIRDSMLVSLGLPQGHLITDSIYKNYRLTTEYRFAGEPGNCGILVHASEPRALYKMFPKSLEVQMMHENAGDFWCIRENITVPNMTEKTWAGGGVGCC